MESFGGLLCAALLTAIGCWIVYAVCAGQITSLRERIETLEREAERLRRRLEVLADRRDTAPAGPVRVARVIGEHTPPPRTNAGTVGVSQPPAVTFPSPPGESIPPHAPAAATAGVMAAPAIAMTAES